MDLPSVMATWETYGGLVVVKTASDGGGSVVLLADSDGQVVRWTLEERRKASQNFTPQEPPSINYQRRSTRGASSGEPVADYGSRVVEVARCSILPPAAGYGKLRRLVSCGPNDRFVVGALHQAVRERFTFVHMHSLARVNGLCQSLCVCSSRSDRSRPIIKSDEEQTVEERHSGVCWEGDTGQNSI